MESVAQIGLPVHFKLPDYEMDALYDLYTSTDGPQWRWFKGSAFGMPWFFNASSDPCAQRWQGVLCSQIPSDGYYYVIGLDLNLHMLNGEIPLSLFNLSEVRGINLASNYLKGSIPSEVARWTELKVFDFSNNLISGNIPHALCELPAVEAIYLYNNHLNGTLPDCIGQLATLEVLKLTLNALTGTIPASLGRLVNLNLLYLGRNAFTGTVPSALGNLSALSSFLLYENALTGLLSPLLVGLTNVSVFNVQLNRLSGTIPSFLANLSSCTFLYLNDNHFTGTISPSLASDPILQNLYLGGNLLTGTIPSELSNITSLLSLELSYNKLHGSIPESLGNLPLLEILSLSGNYLTGTIPSEISAATSLQTLAVASNYLHGTIPETVGALTNLTFFYVYNNSLYGALPSSMNNLTSLINLFMYDNMFSGSLPSLSRLPLLSSIFIQNNHLTGTLENVFDPALQRFLSLIQVSNNQLTGTLPDAIFDLPALQTFVAVSNCFQGSLSSNICKRTTLKTIALDGLRSASSCRNLLLPGLSSSYALTAEGSNSIPLCLFSMPLLNTLHLSGNDLTGTLPHNLNLSMTLMDISLSHNKLAGPIPDQLQERKLYNLDLSFNKFSGTLSKDFGTQGGNRTLNAAANNVHYNFTATYFLNQSNLLLRNNRLSFAVPSSILNRVNISILQGNLFSCELDNSGLPKHDSGLSTYQCGSNTFNVSFYFWLCATVVLVLSVLVIYYLRQRLQRYVKEILTTITNIQRWLTIDVWYNIENHGSSSRLHYYNYVMLVADSVLTISAYCTLFIIVVMLPLYTALSAYYGTHSYQYAWTVSAAFLSGYPAVITMMFFFFLLIGALLIQFRYSFHRLRLFLHELPTNLQFKVLDPIQDDDLKEQDDNRYSSMCEKCAIYVAFFFINVIVVASVNVGYVYAAINEDRKYIFIAQIALSVFKLVWNNTGSKFLIRWTHHYIASSAARDWKFKSAGFFAIQLSVSLLNYIAIPCIVVAVISPNCFNSIIKGAPSVSSHYSYEVCGIDSVYFGCLVYERVSDNTSYNPPFTYSYQCSSSLITYYAPTFVYLCMITVFVSPLLEICLQQTHHRATRGTRWSVVLDRIIPLHLQDIHVEADAHRNYNVFRPYFDANILIVTIVTYLGVLLTFGLVFPPISVVMLVSIFGVIYNTKIKIGRFVTCAIDRGLQKQLDLVENECFGVGSIPKLRQCVRTLVTFSCLFYTLFLFDTLGDAVGLMGALWVLVVLPLFPVLLLLCHRMYIYAKHRPTANNSKLQKSQKISGAIEMENLENNTVRDNSIAEKNNTFTVTNPLNKEKP